MNAPDIGFEPALWDEFVRERDGHLLQTARWGALKAAFGWDYELVALGPGGERLCEAERERMVGGALMLFRPLPLGLGTVAYVPRGPVVDWEDADNLPGIALALDHVARAHNAILLKIEPDTPDTSAMREKLSSLGFHPSVHPIQPPRTIVIDIERAEEAILAGMNQGTRRKIRQSVQKGVSIRLGNTDDLDSFNRLMTITGQRDGFGVHSPAYYRKAYELFAERGEVALLMASYDGKDVAGIMVFALGRRAWYLYGASANEARERMPTYGLQWAAIEWARKRGCASYDLWGIPDADLDTLEAQFQTRRDGLWGVYGFKRGFGGRVMRSVGAWDRVYSPLLYAAYRWAVRGRAQIDG